MLIATAQLLLLVLSEKKKEKHHRLDRLVGIEAGIEIEMTAEDMVIVVVSVIMMSETETRLEKVSETEDTLAHIAIEIMTEREMIAMMGIEARVAADETKMTESVTAKAIGGATDIERRTVKRTRMVIAPGMATGRETGMLPTKMTNEGVDGETMRKIFLSLPRRRVPDHEMTHLKLGNQR